MHLTKKTALLFTFQFLFLTLLSAQNPIQEFTYDKWITDWLLCGPFPNPLAKGVTEYRHDRTTLGYYIDYLQPIGGENKAQPKDGLTFISKDGKQYNWEKYHSAHNYIDLFSIYEKNQGVVAYAATYILAKRHTDVVLSIGSNDGVKIWLNGNVVWDNHLPRMAVKDDDLIRVKLKKGKNTLLLKIDQGSGNWGFYVRFLNLKKEQERVKNSVSSPDKLSIEAKQNNKRIKLVMGKNCNYLILNKIPRYSAKLKNAQGCDIDSLSAPLAESVVFNTENLANGPYWIVCQVQLPNKKTINNKFFFYHGKSKNKIFVYDQHGKAVCYKAELLDARFTIVENALEKNDDGTYSILRPDISPFYLRVLLPSSSLGYRWYLVDNQLKGFSVPNGGNLIIDLPKEAARTIVYKIQKIIKTDMPRWLKDNLKDRLNLIKLSADEPYQIIDKLSSLKCNLFQNNNLRIWYAPGVEKVARNETVPKVHLDAIHVSLAKNEYEPFQLVLNPKADIEDLTINITSLMSGNDSLTSSNFELLAPDYIKIKYPTDYYGSHNLWPDALPPIQEKISLKKIQNNPIWITVHAGKNQKAGIYRGEIKLCSEMFTRNIVVPIEVEVFNFTLPDNPSVETAYGVNINKEYHGNLTPKQWQKIHDLYMKMCAEHRISPYYPQAGAEIKTRYKGNPPKPIIDYSQFDSAMTRYLDHFHFTTFNMGGIPTEILNHKRYTPEFNRLFKLTYSLIQKHLREKGWLDKAYWYWVDEPPINEYEKVKKGMELLKVACPDIRRLLICNNEDAPIPYFFNAVNLSVPIMNHYNNKMAAGRQKMGETVWWYVCTAPKAPYPNNFIDHPAINHRLRFWMIDKYNLDGSLYWSTTYWRQNPWQCAMSYSPSKGKWGNGDGRLLYPPRKMPQNQAIVEAPVTSIRFENIRDGLEDVEYLKLIKKSNDAKKIKKLQEIENSLIKSTTVYEQNPLILMTQRERVARIIQHGAVRIK